MKIDWDFEKGLLAFMAVLIVAGVGVIFWQRGVATDLIGRQQTAESQLARIGRTTQEIHALRSAIDDDEVAKGLGSFEYLEQQMVESLIGKKFKISNREGPEQDGYQDVVWELRPNQTSLDFERRALGVFLIHIEAKTTLMKVTRIKVDVSNRRGASSDDWKPIIEVTERKATSI